MQICLPPEFISKQDGETRNDCERNAARRFFEKPGENHPHLPLIITEDALSSNAPHIRDADKYNLRYIPGVKEGGHSFLSEQIKNDRDAGQTAEFKIVGEENPEMIHRFSFINRAALNASNQDMLVNFLEYREVTPDAAKHFSWVTDFTVTKKCL